MLSVFFPDVLDRLTSRWKRRGAALLQIGAVPGCFPEGFSKLGFDVTVLNGGHKEEAADAGMVREGILERSIEPIPFNDGEFDYAVLMFQGIGASRDSGTAILSEAMRAVKSGVLVLEANALPPWRGRICRDEARILPVLPWKLWNAACHECSGRRMELTSVGFLPHCSSNRPASERRLQRFLSIHESHIPVGELLAMHIRWRGVPLSSSGLVMQTARPLSRGWGCIGKPQKVLAYGRLMPDLNPD